MRSYTGNIVLKRTTPRFWLPTLTIVFGIVATLLGVVQSKTGFFIARFFLGVAECGIFPGVVFYFSMCESRQSQLQKQVARRYLLKKEDLIFAQGINVKSANSVSPSSSPRPPSLGPSVASLPGALRIWMA